MRRLWLKTEQLRRALYISNLNDKFIPKLECIPLGCVPPARYRTGGLPDRDPPGQSPPPTETPRGSDRHLWKYSLRKLRLRAVQALSGRNYSFPCPVQLYFLHSLRSVVSRHKESSSIFVETWHWKKETSIEKHSIELQSSRVWSELPQRWFCHYWKTSVATNNRNKKLFDGKHAVCSQAVQLLAM